MADRDKKIARGDSGSGRAAGSRRGAAWILVAFGLLAVGLVGGTILFAWKSRWGWIFPAASFVGYVLAFRRGLLLWNPAIDRTWRRYLWLEGDITGEDAEILSSLEENPERSLSIVPPETPRPPRHELRVVR
jgi:hypothetical protein